MNLPRHPKERRPCWLTTQTSKTLSKATTPPVECPTNCQRRAEPSASLATLRKHRPPSTNRELREQRKSKIGSNGRLSQAQTIARAYRSPPPTHCWRCTLAGSTIRARQPGHLASFLSQFCFSKCP